MTSGGWKLAVLGDPLAYTRSPELHRAALAAFGLAGGSDAIRTPREALGDRLAELARAGYRGANLTHPLKEAVLASLTHVSEAARRARSVNTVGFGAGGTWGATTDGPGFVDLLRALGRAPASERVVLLGAGGAARSLALALAEAGATVTASARDPVAAAAALPGLERFECAAWRSPEEAAALARATLVVNATPLSGEEPPAPLDRVPGEAAIVDLVYGPEPTPWVRAARAEGRTAHDGLGLLVFQARRSLSLWLEREVPLEPLARAVGWSP